MKIYLVKWIDSYSNSRWYNEEEIEQFIKNSVGKPLVSVGFLYRKTKEYIVLYGDKGDDENARHIYIPKKAVVSMKKIK